MVSFALKPIVQSTNEGGTLSFSITIVNPNYRSIPEYKIYFRTHPTKDNAASASDYSEVYSLKAVTFSSKGSQTQTFTIRTDEDGLVEGREYFSVALYDFQKKFLGIESVFTIKDVPLADLSVGPLKLGATSVAAGGEVKISWSVGNGGPGEAPRSTGLFYLSSNDRFDKNDDVRLDATVSIRSLGDDERTSGSVTVKIPEDWPKGKSYIIFLADAEGDVRESSEANNSISALVQIEPPKPAPWRTIHDYIVPEIIDLFNRKGNPNWEYVSSYELGIAPKGMSANGLQYRFAGGKYSADLVNEEDAVANATLLRGIVDGKRALVILFPGSDETDSGDWKNFDRHYAKFEPLLSNIKPYMDEAGIGQVFLGGYSLGAGMVDNFMANFSGNKFQAFTFGSPGGSHGGQQNDPRIVNLGHTDDWAMALGSTRGYDRHGSDIYINSGILTVPAWKKGLGNDEHDFNVYTANIINIGLFAADKTSPFYYTNLGSTFRDGKPHGGVDVYISVADTFANGRRVAYLSAADQWAFGSSGDDQFHWRVETGRGSVVRIDGGGSSDRDSVVLSARDSGSAGWSWKAVELGHGIAGFELRFGGKLVGELTRIEYLVFGSKWVPLSANSTVAGTSSASSSGPTAAEMTSAPAGPTFSLVASAQIGFVQGGSGNDFLDGGTGKDSMAGGTGDDVFVVDSAGDSVIEAPGEGTDEVRTSLAAFSLSALANVENLAGTSATGQTLTGNSGSNVVTSGSGNDVLHLQGGGDDTVIAGAGSDNIFFIGSLTSEDLVDGGEGVDTLVLQGNYTGGLTLAANVTQIENISILGGNNTNFGEPGTNRYDYVLTTHDANFAAGVQARINGAALLAGEDFTFDGRAETDASFVVYGGKGKDTLLGGLGNDIFFYAEERFASGDTVNGGAGYDGMFLRGNYTIDFNAPGYTGLFTNIENLTLPSATDERYARGGGTEFDYNLTLSDAIVKPGETLTISGALLMASETMVLDGSAELDGLLRLFGGKAGDTLKGGNQADLLHGSLGADTLAGNGGADTFRFDSVAESNSGSMDLIVDFAAGTDKVDLGRIDADTLTAGNQAFAWIGSNAFSGTAGQLRAYEQDGSWFVEGDTNGDTIADLVIQLTSQGPAPLGAADFIL